MQYQQKSFNLPDQIFMMIKKTMPLLFIAIFVTSFTGASFAYTYRAATIQPLEETTMVIQYSQDRQIRLSSNDSAYDVSRSKYDNDITITDQPDGWWGAAFQAPNAAVLTEGFYDHAGRYPFQDANFPGLSIEGDLIGCNKVVGKFKVLEIVYDGVNKVSHLAVDFVQRCEQSSSPAITGAVRYHSTYPITIDLPGQFNGNELMLPYVQVGEAFYKINLSIIAQDPLSLKVNSINPSGVKDDDIRVPSYFEGYFDGHYNARTLYVPTIELTDRVGKKHTLEAVQFSLIGTSSNINVGDTFTLLKNAGDGSELLTLLHA